MTMRQWMSIVGGIASITIAAAAGCYSGDEGAAANGAAASTGASATDPAGTAGDGSAPAPGAPTGLPCEVDELLAKRCRSCHSNPPMAPMALVTYEDLAAPSK